VLRAWLVERFDGRADVAVALEGCTGWRFVVEELQRAGVAAHVAEPADTAALRGRKQRAKTDRADARHLRELLIQSRLPQSWIPPGHVLEVRTLGRLYLALMDDRRRWQQRIHAQLFHQGVPSLAGLLTVQGRTQLARAELSPAGRKTVEHALAAIDGLDELIVPLREQLQRIGRGEPGPNALRAHYGIGSLTATMIWAELGDCRRFDITVWSSDTRRAAGHLSRQGSPVLRWAVYEAAKTAARTTSPDHPYYRSARDRLGAKRATLSVARKLIRRCYHTLRNLDDNWTTPTVSVSRRAA
jgi:transposase